MEKLNLTS